jgi:ABC-type Fe3+ transport system permease subunit
LTLAVFAAVSVAPLAALGWRSLFEGSVWRFETWRAVFAEPRQATILANTLAVSLGTCLTSLLAGGGIALSLQYCPRILRAFFTFLLCVPVLIPPCVFSAAWLDALTRMGILAPQFTAEPGVPFPFRLLSVILVFTLSYYPFVFLCTVAALQRFDRRMLESARLIADPVQTFFVVRFPLCAPWVLTGVGLVFLLTLTEPAVPALFQVNTCSVEIFTELSAFHETGRAVAQALPLLAAGSAILWAWGRWVRPRQQWLASTPKPAGRVPVGWKRALLASGACLFLAALAVGVPLSLLAGRIESWAQLMLAWSDARREILTSLLQSATAATVLTALGFAMAWFANDSPRLGLLFRLSLIPFLLTGPLLGTGLRALWNHPGPTGFVSRSFLILVLANTAKYLYFAYLSERIALLALSRPRLPAARIHRAAPVHVAVWGIACLLSLQELGAVVMVASPDVMPLPVRVHSLMHLGPSAAVASLCLAMASLLFATGLCTAVFCFACGRVLHAYR